jgi:hypothetical protein
LETTSFYVVSFFTAVFAGGVTFFTTAFLATAAFFAGATFLAGAAFLATGALGAAFFAAAFFTGVAAFFVGVAAFLPAVLVFLDVVVDFVFTVFFTIGAFLIAVFFGVTFFLACVTFLATAFLTGAAFFAGAAFRGVAFAFLATTAFFAAGAAFFRALPTEVSFFPDLLAAFFTVFAEAVRADLAPDTAALAFGATFAAGRFLMAMAFMFYILTL